MSNYSIPQPSADNQFNQQQAQLILSSLKRITGKSLFDETLPKDLIYQSLFEAPFCVLSHNTNADPIFNYANQTAMKLFEMEWQSFINLPSRLSAEPQIREEREKLLKHVSKHGYSDQYQGVRISSTGKRFLVTDSLVWNLIDEQNIYQGQAAILFKWQVL